MNDHWKSVALSEICSVSAGNSAPQDPTYFAEGTIPFFRTSDAGRVKFGTIYESQDKLNPRGASKLRRYPAGTILFPKSGASTFLNHRVVLGVEGCVSSHLATIVPNLNHVLPQFLLYALTLIDAKDLIQDQSYPSLNLPAIEKIHIKLPPLAEQQRIVRLLDEAFEGIAIAKANAENNLQSARLIFENYLQTVFQQGGVESVTAAIDDERHITQLQHLCDNYKQDIVDGPFGSNLKREDYVSEGVPVLKIQNVKPLRIELKKMDYVSPDKFRDLQRHSFLRGDIIMTKLGDPLGVSAIVNHLEEGVIVADLVRIRAAKINTKFLCYQLNSPVVKRFINAKQKGTTRPRVTLSVVRELPIYSPPLAEQIRIVTKLDQLLLSVESLIASYAKKKTALDDLKISLLNKLFSGYLDAA